MGDQAQNNANALTEQLQAEISASSYRSIRKVAEALGVDYTTFYRWVTGKRDISMSTVFRVLELLEIEPSAFFTDAQRRAERGSATD